MVERIETNSAKTFGMQRTIHDAHDSHSIPASLSCEKYMGLPSSVLVTRLPLEFESQGL